MSKKHFLESQRKYLSGFSKLLNFKRKIILSFKEVLLLFHKAQGNIFCSQRRIVSQISQKHYFFINEKNLIPKGLFSKYQRIFIS